VEFRWTNVAGYILNSDLLSQVENEALYGALQRMQQQSMADQQEISRLTGDLSQGKARVAEIQEMIGMLQKEKQALLRSVGDDGNDVREELQKLTNLLTEAEARLVAAKKSLEDDQKSTWELEDKLKKEKAAREACQQRIKQMEVEVPARMEQERIYRQNQEQLKLKLEQSRDKFKSDLEKARKKLEEEQRLVKEAQAAEAKTENTLASASHKNQEIQVQVKDTEKMLRATEGLVSPLSEQRLTHYLKCSLQGAPDGIEMQRLEVMGRHEALNADMNRLKSQYQVRIICDLSRMIDCNPAHFESSPATVHAHRCANSSSRIYKRG